MPLRPRVLALLALGASLLLGAAPASAVKGGTADNGAHPYVGQMFAFDPAGADARFGDPGSWFTCTATLVSPTVVVTAGHCASGVGVGGSADPDNTGGTDVWLTLGEVPDKSMLAPSSTFSSNADRYAAWSQAFDASTSWVRATAYPHPLFDAGNPARHDLGVLVLDHPVDAATYGALPTLGLLDALYAQDKQATYPVVGYGAEDAGPKYAVGGGTRRTADLRLVNLNGALGYGKGDAAKFSNNASTGGICAGDSGGPVLAPGTTTLVGVVSFTENAPCSGSSGVYRLDQQDDLDFLTQFGVA